MANERHDPDKAALQARVAELEKLLTDHIKAQAGMIIDEQYEEWKKWASLPSQEKSQLMANKIFPKGAGERDFLVNIPKNPEHPQIKLPGHSREEAEGRYRKLCGILPNTEHAIEAIEAQAV